MPSITQSMTPPRRTGRAAPPAYASTYHTPVLVRETVSLLVTDPKGVYVDGTLGGGGHAAAILDALAPEGRLVGIDQDPEAIAAATSRIGRDEKRFSTLQGNARNLDQL